jgi:hypothetical protein
MTKTKFDVRFLTPPGGSGSARNDADVVEA